MPATTQFIKDLLIKEIHALIDAECIEELLPCILHLQFFTKDPLAEPLKIETVDVSSTECDYIYDNESILWSKVQLRISKASSWSTNKIQEAYEIIRMFEVIKIAFYREIKKAINLNYFQRAHKLAFVLSKVHV